MGISAAVFHRFILASFLSTGRGPLLTCLDFELLLRTMMMQRLTKEGKGRVGYNQKIPSSYYTQNYIIAIAKMWPAPSTSPMKFWLPVVRSTAALITENAEELVKVYRSQGWMIFQNCPVF
jgi:hypothetical protein